ncbi:MAG: DUF1858 domain-containing protein [Treponema sp.]|jgi:hypothetical protein|nr:DUF1858 domain-containing protein [Treponema sp.]
MDINLETKIAAMLDAYPLLETTLVEVSPLFANLKNPILRNTVAKVTSLQHAAKKAGISPDEMLQVVRKAAGLSENVTKVEV